MSIAPVIGADFKEPHSWTKNPIELQFARIAPSTEIV